MSQEPEYFFSFGSAQRREEFASRHITILKSLDSLRQAVDVVVKKANTKTPEGRVMYILGRIAIEDLFNALVLLCANGYSDVAKQILRSMFEWVVSLCFMNKHREKIQDFLNYSWIDRGKEINRIGDILKDNLTEEGQKHVEEVMQKFTELRDEYKNHGWSKTDRVQMAKDLDFPKQVIEIAYYHGLQEAHPSYGAVIKRIEAGENNTLLYREMPSPEDSENILMIGQWMAIKVVEELKDFFQIDELDELVSQCVQEMINAWKSSGDSKTLVKEILQ
jgi:hypothetical protein